MSSNNKIFTYDKKNHLIAFAELSKKGELLKYYFVSDTELMKINVYKDKKKNHVQKTVVKFKEQIRLQFMFLEGYGTRISAIKKDSQNIESATVESRIECTDGVEFDVFTVKSDLLKSWIDKV